MSDYKLIYFDTYGRGEPIRLIFALVFVIYAEVRVKKEAWPHMTPTLPWGQLPVLEVGGETIGQSATIARFLARRFNLVGSNEFQTELTENERKVHSFDLLGLQKPQTIAALVDNSEYSERVVRVAFNMKRAIDTLLVVNAVEMTGGRIIDSDDDVRTVNDGLKQKSHDFVLSMIQSYTCGDLVKGVSLAGKDLSAKDTIVQFIRQNDVDTVVVGPRGSGVMKKLLLGSFSEYVISHVRCNVMIARV